MKNVIKKSIARFASVGCATLLLAWSATIYAQTATIRGKISALKGQELIVETRQRGGEGRSH